MDSKIQQIAQKIDSFPPLPTTVAKVIEVTNNPESSANDLVRVVASDQSMCSAILKIANSSLFGRPRRVNSLETAIMVLGFNEVQSIVLGKAVVSSFSEVFKQNRAEITWFWDHSFTTGLAAKIIADHLGQSPGQYFIGGLLHDIGKLAMMLTFANEYSAAKWMTGFSTEEQLAEERQVFSLSHDMVGSRLLEKWLFPEDILMGLEYHHAPAKAPRYSAYASVMQLSDILSYLCCNEDIMEGQELLPAICGYLPDIETQWTGHKLPWGTVLLESWFAWLKIDREHGSSIITILAS